MYSPARCVLGRRKGATSVRELPIPLGPACPAPVPVPLRPNCRAVAFTTLDPHLRFPQSCLWELAAPRRLLVPGMGRLEAGWNGTPSMVLGVARTPRVLGVRGSWRPGGSVLLSTAAVTALAEPLPTQPMQEEWIGMGMPHRTPPRAPLGTHPTRHPPY